MEDIKESFTGYSCPNCGATSTHLTIIQNTEPEFFEEPDPHYEWVEIHKCHICETIYKFIKSY